MKSPDNEHDDSKRQATVIAQLALAGFVVTPARIGGFVVGRADSSRFLGDLHALESFARTAGGAPPGD
jgi:hypothetical protein